MDQGNGISITSLLNNLENCRPADGGNPSSFIEEHGYILTPVISSHGDMNVFDSSFRAALCQEKANRETNGDHRTAV